MEGYHEPVLLLEVIDALKVEDGKWYIDATLGDGGHSLEILKRGGNVLGIDVDPQAIERARRRLQGAGLRLRGRSDSRSYSGQGFILIKGNFRNLKNLIYEQTDITGLKFAGALFDLGVSSLQLESPQRGFSFASEGLLDMRMDPSLQVKALDLVNAGGRKELYELFSRLGEEKFARAIANALVSARALRPIRTTRELAEIVEKAVGRRTGEIHPATRAFQALRIAVNDELNALQEGLDQVIDLIQNYGCILVISFHSLEDRIAKITFKKWQDQGLGKVLTKKPIVPGEDEIQENPRSRSAKMRVFEVI